MPRPFIAFLVLLLLLATAGCGSKAGEYAQDARSSYISARAVLVGVQEFPAVMETVLRAADTDALYARASALIEDTRNILPAAYSAFRTLGEKCELLKGEGSAEFDPYADMLLELAGLNGEVLDAYSEFIAISNSVLQGLPYEDNPQALMPALQHMDSIVQRIQGLCERISLLEEEAEALYLRLTS